MWGWYPTAGDEVLDHYPNDYLGNKKVAYYYWLLAIVMVTTSFLTLIVGYSCDIGLNRTEIKHQVLVNEETSGQDQLPSPEHGTEINTQGSPYVELS